MPIIGYTLTNAVGEHHPEGLNTMAPTIAAAEVAAKAIKWQDHYTEPYIGEDDAKALDIERRCTKCNGTGYINAYAHVRAGVCFDCGGHNSTWVEHTTVGRERAKAKKRAQAAAGRERKEVRRLATLHADRWAATGGFADIFPALAWCTPEGMDELADIAGGPFERPMETARDIYFNAQRGLSEEAREVLASCITEVLNTAQVRAAKEAGWVDPVEAARVPVPAGEYVGLEGTVLQVCNRIEYGHYGQRIAVLKMLFEDDRGFRLWATAPRKLLDLAEAAAEAEEEAGATDDDEQDGDYALTGRRAAITFRKVKASGDDEFFGYGSVPSKMRLL